MRALGRTINIVPSAKNTYISMQDCSSIAFVSFLTGAAGDTMTLTEAKDAAGTGAKVLAVITKYYTSSGVGGVWTEQNQAAASTLVTTATAAQNSSVMEINDTSLDDGYKYLKVNSSGASVISAILSDLEVGRRPSLLVSPVL